MKLRRYLSLILVMVMMCTMVFSSCSNGNEGTTETTKTTETTSAVTNESTETTETTKIDTTELETTESETTEIETSENETSKTETTEKETTKTETTKAETTETETTETETTETETTETETTETETTETETTETEEPVVITDVMIGETIEAEYASDFSVSRVFSNDMVVQRNEHIRVWGFAPESENGKKVSGEFKGMFAESLIENGEWCITFGARLEADVNGAEMKIYTDSKEVVFSGVLVGDVYMVVGQSNVEVSVQEHINNTDAATQGGGKAAIDPNSIIRLNRTNNGSGGDFEFKGTDYVYKDFMNPTQWTKTTESETLKFSALGYYFAVQMVEKTGGQIPVGIIEIGFSGAPIGAFMPNEVAEKYDTDIVRDSTGKLLTTGMNSTQYAGRQIYNCHIAPFEKYAMAGLIWYQGESNCAIDEAVEYNELFSALMTYMRSTHNLINKDFPVFIVEFPSIYQKPAGFSGTWHYSPLEIIRPIMGSIPLQLKNSYISASSDLWNDKTFYNSLHPNIKYEQAGRLAELADVVICENGTLEEATGPILKGYSINDDKLTVILTFKNVGEGLTTLDGGEVKGIVGLLAETAGIKLVNPVKVEITSKNQITVTFDKPIKSVAYNYYDGDFFGETINLCDSDKFPATAFLTPFESAVTGAHTSDTFVHDSASELGKVAKSIDTLIVDSQAIYSGGAVDSKLAAAGGKVTVSNGTIFVRVAGWVGFNSPITYYGYSIDGSDAIFKSLPAETSTDVKNAGGKYAERFYINVNVASLAPGEHTVKLLALLDKNDGVAVEILSFTVVVKAKECPHTNVSYTWVEGEAKETMSCSDCGHNEIIDARFYAFLQTTYNNGASTSAAVGGSKLMTIDFGGKPTHAAQHGLVAGQWAYVSGGIKEYAFSVDGGKTWYKVHNVAASSVASVDHYNAVVSVVASFAGDYHKNIITTIPGAVKLDTRTGSGYGLEVDQVKAVAKAVEDGYLASTTSTFTIILGAVPIENDTAIVPIAQFVNVKLP